MDTPAAAWFWGQGNRRRRFDRVGKELVVNRRLFLAAAAGAAANVWARPLGAAQIDDVHFHDQVKTSNTTLKLQGTGLFYHNASIKVAAAAFYLSGQDPAVHVLADVPKLLDMEYFRRVRARDLVAGANAMLDLNVPAEQLRVLRPQISALHAQFQNVRAGDRCSLTYLPGVGTWLTVNGSGLGRVPGAAFAAAYFTIWFGRRPMDDRLKRQLLGG
jgi:hypothetical protein